MGLLMLVWRWSRAKTPGLVGDPIRGFNRGVAVIGDKVLVVTDNGHLLALHRLNGGLIWETDMVGDVPVRNHYGATSAPAVARRRVRLTKRGPTMPGILGAINRRQTQG